MKIFRNVGLVFDLQQEMGQIAGQGRSNRLIRRGNHLLTFGWQTFSTNFIILLSFVFVRVINLA